MCGIVVTPLGAELSPDSAQLMILRGPDGFGKLNFNGYEFLHYLLKIEKSGTLQPLESDQTIVLFNGEIYNFRDFDQQSSEVVLIQKLYECEGVSGLRQLDGEYVIVIYDKRAQSFIVATDTFGTKPIFYSCYQRKVYLASYGSVLRSLGCKNIRRLSPNKFTEICALNGKVTSVTHNYRFSLEQRVRSYDRWFELLEGSVDKRFGHGRPDQSVFLGLSSGYDSGAIAAVLERLGRRYTAFSVVDDKNKEKIVNRNLVAKYLDRHILIQDARVVGTESRWPVEDQKFRIYSDTSKYLESGTSTRLDRGAIGLSEICNLASQMKLRVYLSGAGADEIYSDYGFRGGSIYPHSNFGGDYPNDLATIFPWASFYGSSMQSYLLKEELVSGFFSMEGRYPFLDQALVQEYLCFVPELKNYEYKAPIAQYLRYAGYPVEFGQKLGF